MIVIQKPTKEDIKDMVKVSYETWLATYPNEEIGITIEDIKERFKKRFYREAINKKAIEVLDASANNLYLVAKNKDMVVGFCRAKKNRDINELKAIYILPEYQRNGIGKMFWSEILKFFGKEKDIIVNVAIYNEKAISFYRKLGFIDEGRRFVDESSEMPVSQKCIPEMEMVIKNK